MCKQIYPVADHESPSAILCDAIAIAALFSLILILIPNFMPTSYLAHQRVQFLLLVMPLYVTLAFIRQVIFEKTIPVELSFLNTLGVGKGFLLGVYCFFQCLHLRLVLLCSYTNLKVVWVESLLVFLT